MYEHCLFINLRRHEVMTCGEIHTISTNFGEKIVLEKFRQLIPYGSNLPFDKDPIPCPYTIDLYRDDYTICAGNNSKILISINLEGKDIEVVCSSMTIIYGTLYFKDIDYYNPHLPHYDKKDLEWLDSLNLYYSCYDRYGSPCHILFINRVVEAVTKNYRFNKSKIKISKVDTIIDEHLNVNVYTSVDKDYRSDFLTRVRLHKQHRVGNIQIRLLGGRSIVFDHDEYITSSYCNDRDGGYEKYTTYLNSHAVKYIPTDYEYFTYLKTNNINTNFIHSESTICSGIISLSSNLTWEEFEEAYSVIFDFKIREDKEYVDFEEYYNRNQGKGG